MADISPKDVAALRKATGAGMMDCKQALEESDGDLEAAKDWLRTKGLAGATKRAGRAAEQGAVDVYLDGNTGGLVELTCETDFVAKGSDFRDLTAKLAKLVAEHGDDGLDAQPLDGSTVGEIVTQLASKLGENVGLGRVQRLVSDDGIVDAYKHIQNERGTIGVLVEVGGVRPDDEKAREVAHDVALHIASAAPRWVTRADVPADVRREGAGAARGAHPQRGQARAGDPEDRRGPHQRLLQGQRPARAAVRPRARRPRRQAARVARRRRHRAPVRAGQGGRGVAPCRRADSAGWC